MPSPPQKKYENDYLTSVSRPKGHHRNPNRQKSVREDNKHNRQWDLIRARAIKEAITLSAMEMHYDK